MNIDDNLGEKLDGISLRITIVPVEYDGTGISPAPDIVITDDCAPEPEVVLSNTLLLGVPVVLLQIKLKLLVPLAPVDA